MSAQAAPDEAPPVSGRDRARGATMTVEVLIEDGVR